MPGYTNLYRRWCCTVNLTTGRKECNLIQTDPTRGFLTKGACEKSCIEMDSSREFITDDGKGIQSNPAIGWSCNIYTGDCELVHGGVFESKEYCEKSGCHALNGSPLAATLEKIEPVYGWTCDTNSGTCIKVLGGPHISKEGCESECTWNGGPSTPLESEISHWRWFCSNEGCKYVRTSKKYEGFIRYSQCAANCSVRGKGSDVIITNIDNIRNMGSIESTGKDSYQTSPIEGGVTFFGNSNMTRDLHTELRQLVDSENLLRIDFRYYENLSKFFTTYTYPNAIVKRGDFIQYIIDSLNPVKEILKLEDGGRILKISSDDFAAGLQTFITAVNQPNYLNLDVRLLHNFWNGFSEHSSLSEKAPKEVLAWDTAGNFIHPGPKDVKETVPFIPSNLLEEPKMVKFHELNPITEVSKKISYDDDIEATKMTVELAINKFPKLWRDGLRTISRNRPLSEQPYIEKSFDNIKDIVPYYGTNNLVTNRNITGELNNTIINLNQKIDFNVPEDNYASRDSIKYIQYSIDFRTNLNVSSTTSHILEGTLNLENGEQGLVLSEGDSPLDVSFNPSNSIVVSVTRKAKPPTSRR